MSESNEDFLLGPILVSPDRLRLSIDGRSVTIEPRVMDVLVALSLKGDAVLSREALQTQVWGETHVGYHALARAVYEARKALQDLSPGCDLVETIPRRGYRLKVARTPIAPAVVQNADRIHRVPGLAQNATAAAVCLLILGLIMHAFGAHGTWVHYLGAAAIIGWTTLRPMIRQPARHPTGD